VLNNPSLRNSFASNDARIRYGNACRDLTSELPQDCIALWAGIASKAIKKLTQSPEAAIHIYSSDQSGAVEIHNAIVTQPITIQMREWTIRFDQWLLRKLAAIRDQRLPNETGGVLLGAFDTQRRVCSILDMLPSPPDSHEWPTSYIRGYEGLAEQVRLVQTQTLGQVSYVGEWHSHPANASTTPSTDDFKAYQWLVGHMSMESLPAIMMIVGDHEEYCLVSTEQRTASPKQRKERRRQKQ
jgi:integrative and conjugative element protein (TIGR02256 family)